MIEDMVGEVQYTNLNTDKTGKKIFKNLFLIKV